METTGDGRAPQILCIALDYRDHAVETEGLGARRQRVLAPR